MTLQQQAQVILDAGEAECVSPHFFVFVSGVYSSGQSLSSVISVFLILFTLAGVAPTRCLFLFDERYENNTKMSLMKTRKTCFCD